jgi:transposase
MQEPNIMLCSLYSIVFHSIMRRSDMPALITLSDEQRAELEHARKHHVKPYVREKCAAIIKVADGRSCREVAKSGLVNAHALDTITDWIKAYAEHGLEALVVHPGRGRKPAFSPSGQTQEQAKEQIVELVHQDPHQFGQFRNRWTLGGILCACRSLRTKSLSAVWNVLHRLQIHYKRATGHLFSPDPNYRGKLAEAHCALQQAAQHPDRTVVLYGDEITFYRQPTLSQAWEQSGRQQPRAELGYRSNLLARVAGVMNAFTGQVHYLLKSKVGIGPLVDFYQRICKAYPDAQRIYLIEDNWPIHFHPDVVAVLEPQLWPYPPTLPSTWPTEPKKKTPRLNLPIQIVPLPTYAPWTNPIEKLWRMLRQTELHLHRFRDDWDGLKQCVTEFLDRFAHSSPNLLTYVGLKDPPSFYHDTLALTESALLVGTN